MANKRYSHEFKLEALRLAFGGGSTPTETARDLGITTSVLYQWRRKFAGEFEVKKESLEDENARLKKELAQVKLEREILKKAAAYFAKDED